MHPPTHTHTLHDTRTLQRQALLRELEAQRKAGSLRAGEDELPFQSMKRKSKSQRSSKGGRSGRGGAEGGSSGRGGDGGHA